MEGTHAMSTPILHVEGLRLSRGTREILRGVDLTVADGEFVALMGLSGSGKTTILRAVAGLEPFTAGRVVVDGLTLDSAAGHDLFCRSKRKAFDVCCFFKQGN